jgi:hypothetical protein
MAAKSSSRRSSSAELTIMLDFGDIYFLSHMGCIKWVSLNDGVLLLPRSPIIEFGRVAHTLIGMQ